MGSEDKDIIVVDELPKQTTPSDKDITEKITGIFKRDRSISSSSSESDDEKKHEIPLPSEKEAKHSTSESSSSSSESEDEVDKKKQPDVVVPIDIEERPDADVEKVIKVEEVTKQGTSADTPIMEEITGIFKRHQSNSSSSSDSDDEK